MAANQQDEKKSEYTVLQPLRHDFKHYVKGVTVKLTAKQAKPLIDRNVVAAKSATAE